MAAANAEYDAGGYDYTVEVGAQRQGLDLRPDVLRDRRATPRRLLRRRRPLDRTAGKPVTTVFTLYGINSTPYDTTDDTAVATSGTLFANEIQADYSGNYGQPAGWSGVGSGSYTNCAANPYHNAWWPMATGLAAGTYRLNVTTSDAGNNSTNAENMWSVWVSGGSQPRIYGGGKMAAYNNLDAGTQLFYLAQIDAVHAGKTMVIELFDPGDVSGNASLRILSPDGNAYNYATFSYVADNGRHREQRDVGPDRLRRHELLQQLGPDHPDRPAVDLWQRRPDATRRDRGRLVEDRIHGRWRQRHDDLAGQHPRQPGPPGPSVDRPRSTESRPPRPPARGSSSVRG